MNFYYLYRPATREYVGFYHIDKYGPHVVWTPKQSIGYQFPNQNEARKIAATLYHADHLIMEIFPFRQMGKITIDYVDQGEAS
jgi:hypothetical protein